MQSLDSITTRKQLQRACLKATEEARNPAWCTSSDSVQLTWWLRTTSRIVPAKSETTSCLEASSTKTKSSTSTWRKRASSLTSSKSGVLSERYTFLLKTTFIYQWEKSICFSFHALGSSVVRVISWLGLMLNVEETSTWLFKETWLVSNAGHPISFKIGGSSAARTPTIVNLWASTHSTNCSKLLCLWLTLWKMKGAWSTWKCWRRWKRTSDNAGSSLKKCLIFKAHLSNSLIIDLAQIIKLITWN